MAYQLRLGDMCAFKDLTQGVHQGHYYQVTLAHNPDEVERIARALKLPVVPYAVMVGRGEIWVCEDYNCNHPNVGYEFVGYQGVMQ